ncbi:hypothetical protein K491DRAFT_307138 [Lophiostoma macrostomum CBS 122681]|uniref:Uncharacterized protein n=1 Tax=Lophiostoma macrostomum CBS 122681 TaxID=1314788 RepID=A0A6A6TDI9_9PLEO|nr:hypothetical protein K491DRAFT_307138 [Lophiostoma macrostomum CBS 122681]
MASTSPTAHLTSRMPAGFRPVRRPANTVELGSSDGCAMLVLASAAASPCRAPCALECASTWRRRTVMPAPVLLIRPEYCKRDAEPPCSFLEPRQKEYFSGAFSTGTLEKASSPPIRARP